MPADRKFVLLASLIVGCAGCAVGPSYHAPEPEVPQSYGETGSNPGKPEGPEADAGHLTRWWTFFGDPMLDSLVERALLNNRDLQTAISRVREARAERGVAAGALIPEVDATAGYNRSRGSKNVSLPLSSLGGGSSSSPKAGGSATPAALGQTAPHDRLATAGGGSDSAAQPSENAQPGGQAPRLAKGASRA